MFKYLSHSCVKTTKMFLGIFHSETLFHSRSPVLIFFMVPPTLKIPHDFRCIGLSQLECSVFEGVFSIVCPTPEILWDRTLGK